MSRESDYTVHLHGITDLAVRISERGDDSEAEWLPRSQIRGDDRLDRSDVGTEVTLTIPDWLAERVGL